MPKKQESESTDNTRTYVVMIRPEVETVDIVASTPQQAINLVAAEYGAGLYVAVTERSWTQIDMLVEPQPPKLIGREMERTAAKPEATEEQQALVGAPS